jgi:hypothetical protein
MKPIIHSAMLLSNYKQTEIERFKNECDESKKSGEIIAAASTKTGFFSKLRGAME